MIRPTFQKAFGFEIWGIPVLPTLIGSFFLMATMFMWYGGFFVDRFHPLMGIVEEDVTGAALGWWYPIGLVLSMSQGLGVAIVLKWRNWPTMLGTIQTALTTSVFFAVTTFSYRMVILPEHSIELFLINASGIVTAFSLSAVITTVLRPRHVGVNDQEAGEFPQESV